MVYEGLPVSHIYGIITGRRKGDKYAAAELNLRGVVL